MNSKELAHILSKEYHLSQYLSNQILKTILKTIVSELKKGNLVRLRNFGTFRARKSHGKLRAKFDDSKNFFKD
ncbi:MAG: HU family DNA-binding protein [Candidatus Omnitrophota bacterium]